MKPLTDAERCKPNVKKSLTTDQPEPCVHEWKIQSGDWDCSLNCTMVECIKCEVYGERNDDTGEVFWPAT